MAEVNLQVSRGPLVEDAILPGEFPFVLAAPTRGYPLELFLFISLLGVAHTAHVIWIQSPNHKRAGLWLEILRGDYCYYYFSPLTAIVATERLVHQLPLLEVDFS